MSEIGPTYQLPEMRPFHQLQTRTRLVGGAVVTENGVLESDNFLAGVSGWQIKGDGDVEFNDGTFRGSIEATSIDIGGADASSFHVDASGNMWLGAASFASAPFKVGADGSVTITGGAGSSFQTSVSGTRIAISSTDPDRITFFDSSGGSGFIKRESVLGSIQINDNLSIVGAISMTGGATIGGGIAVGSSIVSTLFGNPVAIPRITSSVYVDVASSAVLLDSSGITMGAGTSLTLSSGLVTRGAVDSGGAGFRLLRVPN